jgi:hypothetical protein
MYAGYAPELNIVGAVLGSPVGDLGNTYHRLNGKFFSGLPTMVVAALMHTYPDFKRVIEERATPEGQAMLDQLKKMTTAHAVARLRKKDMATMLDRPLDEILGMPEVQHVFDNIRLGVAAPTMPVLIVQAAHDRIISVDDIDALADSYAAGGTDVTYHRDRFCEHILLHPMSAPMTLRWLRDRFTGPTSALAPEAHHVAHSVQPVDVSRHGPPGPDQRQSDHRTARRAASPFSVRQIDHVQSRTRGLHRS